MYKLLIRPILFWFDPEEVHYFSFTFIRFISKNSIYSDDSEVDLRSKGQPIGTRNFRTEIQKSGWIGCRFDKDAKCYQELSNFGFGFIEIGTLTPKPQDGNPKKRLFRLKTDSAIINRMGFITVVLKPLS